MKRITSFLMMLMISFMGFSQQEVVQDFESSPAVVGFEGLTSATIIADPTTGGNGNVFELVTNTGGNPWQGAEVVLADDSVLDLTSDLTVSVDVYSTVAFSPMLKVESSQGAPPSANTQSHTGSGWETLTYTLNTGSDNTSTANGTYTKVVFFPNRSSDDAGWNTPPIDVTVLFDNVVGVKTTLGDDPVGNPPSTAAPTPPSLPDSEVISFYSDAYTQQPLNFDVDFCGTGSTEELQVDGDNIILYKTNNCQGIQLDSPVNATTFTTLHFDFYVDEQADLIGSVISLKLNQTNGEGPDDDIFLDNVLTEGSNPPIVAGEWVSVEIDVDLSNFDALDEVVITAGTLGDELYYDNFYLSGGNLNSDSFAKTKFAAYPNPTHDAWIFESDSDEITSIKVFDINGRLVAELANSQDNVLKIEASSLESGLYFANVKTENSSETIKLIKK